MSRAYREPRRKRYADHCAPPTVWGHSRRGAGVMSLVGGNGELMTPARTVGDTAIQIPVFVKLQLLEIWTTFWSVFGSISADLVPEGNRRRALCLVRTHHDAALDLLHRRRDHSRRRIHSVPAQGGLDSDHHLHPHPGIDSVAGTANTNARAGPSHRILRQTKPSCANAASGLRNSAGSTGRGVPRAMNRAWLKDRKNDPPFVSCPP